ncbi:receptor-like cytoplasmic kinase 176 isoform X1 [Cajanus cajan]|uniref:receptor-like cytoplasmic kinase 176 isoform X1 n=1 Tax=Cajanus cajan TaxID=3821 RepID=UPI00098D8B0A|nr:receptor-like cytoplasmic kinase 176 isoform X1 [Cajanus cajan]
MSDVEMDSELVGSIEMGDMRLTGDAILSYSWRVDSLIRSETASHLGDSPLYTFASRVDSAIRSSSASYEADYEAHNNNSTTTNVPSHFQAQTQLSLQQVEPDKSHSNEPEADADADADASSGIMRSTTLAAKRGMGAPRMRWTTTLPSRFVHVVQLLGRHQSKRLNSKDGSKEENGFSGLSGKVSSSSMLLSPQSEDDILQFSNLKSFTFNELRIATRNFRRDGIVGEGGFGFVFRGWIDKKTRDPAKPGTGMVIAVKRLNKESFQGFSEWSAEINCLGRLCHPNIVKLIGYSLEGGDLSLVYEFVAKGSLDNHLFRRACSWTIRVKVALDAANVLAFLHSDEVNVIYRDFKSSNILLDSNYNIKLCDFGMAINGPEGDKSHVSTIVKGTYGYAAPEYIATGRLTKKSDVYSFGVVLLELMSGKRVMDKNRPKGEHNLVEWAKPLLIDKKRISKVMDARIEGQYSYREAKRIAQIAIHCLSTEPKVRPDMNEVVRSLEHLQDSKTQVIKAPFPRSNQ